MCEDQMQILMLHNLRCQQSCVMFTAKLAVLERQSWSGDDAMLMLVRRTSLCTPELRNSQFINAIGIGRVWKCLVKCQNSKARQLCKLCEYPRAKTRSKVIFIGQRGSGGDVKMLNELIGWSSELLQFYLCILSDLFSH